MDASHAIARIESPIGLIALTATGAWLTGVRILTERDTIFAPTTPVLRAATAQIAAYFAGDLTDFTVPLEPLATPRGEALRAAIASVPYGQSVSYGTLARQFASAPRAVGQACRRNPFPIIIPCHRVHSAAGPEHYSGGAGPATKAWLMDFETAHLPPEHRTRLL